MRHQKTIGAAERQPSLSLPALRCNTLSQVPGEISGWQIGKFPDTPGDRQARDAMDDSAEFDALN
jgi:hypothetical protein